MHALPTSLSTTSHVATTVGVVALVVGSVAVWGVSPGLIAVIAVASIAAWVDVTSLRIPDQLVLLALVPTAVLLLAGRAPLGGVVIGIAVFTLPLLAIHLLSPHAMGFGDVKLAVPLGAALGVVDPLLGLIALCVGSGVSACAGLALRRPALPFAPGLVLGSVVALATSTPLTDWFFSWR